MTNYPLNRNIRNLYLQHRKSGETAVQALRSARIRFAFDQLPEGYRIDSEPDDDCDIFDMDDDRLDSGSDQRREYWKQHYINLADRTGCWIVGAKSPDGEWLDTVGGCWGYDDPCNPLQNWYIVDLMQSAIEDHENALLAAG